MEHVEWARGVARRVRHIYQFAPGGQEQDDLESVAVLELFKRAGRFQFTRVRRGSTVLDAFRGWLEQYIVSQCRREGRRLRNGGTYHTRREVEGVALVVAPMGDHDGDLEDAPQDEPVPERVGPHRAATFPRHCPACGRGFRGVVSRTHCSPACRDGEQ
ncbi:unnamed protein product [Gemmataceae bacterium]|nr:unnamed protein product [Gemmataceae bacterium]VTT98957.1 unnamed protein product [Gemmataceae bacterium]